MIRRPPRSTRTYTLFPYTTLFRSNYVIEVIQLWYLTEDLDYTSLDSVSRFDLPIFGGLAIITIAWLTGYKYARTGIPFVLHRLKTAHGIIPLKNTINQFIGSAIAIASGFSVGREGPAVHLGAACSSFIGSKLQLPYNSIRTLCACGIAAGIAASFNTPLAAVIFVMEVILHEYKVYMFIPIMLAAIVGTLVTNSFGGITHELEFFKTVALEVQHYPSLLLLGLFLGILAFLYNRYLVAIIKRSAKFHIVARILCAGFITGVLAYYVPFAMGNNISAVDFSLSHQWQLDLLLGLLAAKFVMTVVALGLGVPGGTIGPILSIGAIAGTCTSVIVLKFIAGEHIASDFALMGMAGFMAATLNAPLAALLAVVELSNQLETIVPAMIVISAACISSGQIFKNRSLFTVQLDVQGLNYRKTPIEQSLQKIGVLGVLSRHFSLFEASQHAEALDNAINATATDKKGRPIECFTLEKRTVQGINQLYWLAKESLENAPLNNETPKITEHLLFPLSSQSTLAEVYLALVDQRSGGVYIYNKHVDDIIGIITFEQIRLYLLTGKL